MIIVVKCQYNPDSHYTSHLKQLNMDEWYLKACENFNTVTEFITILMCKHEIGIEINY